MSNLSGRDLAAARVFIFVLLGILAAGMSPVQAEDVIEKPLPEACGLLDDPEKRAIMDGLLFKLLVACDRTDELGLVHQAPAVDVGPGTDDGPDVVVNDPSGDSGTSTTQSETSMAVNEVTGTVCAGYNDSVHYFVSGEGFTGFSRSTNNGATFVDQGALGADSIGDPAIVWRRADGHFYFGALHTNGLGLWKSTDDCQNFQWVGMMHSGGSDDKELLAVDNNPASPHYGNLYMVFTNFSVDSRIWALRSTDAGVTWTNSQAISATSGVQGSWPAVAPNGDVFVGWVKFGGSTVTMEIARSTDGGVSYSAVASPAANKASPQNSVASGNCGRAALKGNIRYLPSPQVVVGPDGVLHTVYSYGPGGGDDCDSFYRRSADSGATWGPEIRLHDDTSTSDQFFPTLSVGAGNIVSATWYDRRLDPTNSMVDYYHAFSFDGGLTWQPNQRISDVSTPIHLDSNLATCYHGDYDTHVQTATHAVTQWADDRNIMNGHNDPDVFSDPVPISTDFLLAADPTDVSVCSPNTAVFTVNMLQFQGFTELVTLSASGVPTGATAGFVPNPVTPPATSTLTVSGTAGAAPGTHQITITGTSAPSAVVHDTGVTLHLYNANPGAADLVAPADASLNQSVRPTFSWAPAAQAENYRLQVATDAGFLNVMIDEAGISDTGFTPAADLASNTEYFWRVGAFNTCGSGDYSAVFSFYTEALPGDCGFGTMPSVLFFDDLETGGPGWALGAGGSGNTWSLSSARSYSGATSYYVVDPPTTSDQRLDSPDVILPTGVSPLTLQFWNWQLMEDRSSGCYDGGDVEISTDGGSSWTPLPNSAMLTDPYDGPTNGLDGLDGWCDDLGAASTVWKKMVVDLDAYAGETVRFRFRLGSDSSVDREGWYIDDVKVQSCTVDGPPLFADGFETGDTTGWTTEVP